jgi:glutamyl-tRNA synthetase
MDQESNPPVRVRFAPSPTGRTHLGSGRTALYNFLLARQTGGKFILRIEDTDRKRYNPQSEQELIESLHWLGIDWDEGPDVGGPHAPYHQSQRKSIYLEYAQKLIDRGKAYYCFCTPERLARVRQEQIKRKDSPHYDGTCRRLTPQEADRRVAAGEPHVIRFKTPRQGTITVRDNLRGEITVENSNIDDYIIVKSDGLALYHLAAMVDDHLMDITHVIRGSEWLPTFPLHAHIIRALGWEEPIWLHLSIFLKPSGKGKMSKRDSNQLMKDGFSIYLADLKSLGYIPEGVINWTALMGWSYDDRTEFFTMDDLIEKFDVNRLNPSPAAINFSKLDHFNGLHIRHLEVPDLAERIRPYFEEQGLEPDQKRLEEIVPIIQERIVTLDDAVTFAGFFFMEEVHPPAEILIGKNMSAEDSAAAALKAYAVIAELPDIQPETTEAHLRALADQLGLRAGQLFGIIRAAVTGSKVSPPLLESMSIIGKEKVLERLELAAEELTAMVQ